MSKIREKGLDIERMSLNVRHTIIAFLRNLK